MLNFITKLYLCALLKNTLHFNLVKMFPSFVWRSVRKLPARRDTPGFMLCPEQDSKFTLPSPCSCVSSQVPPGVGAGKASLAELNLCLRMFHF